MADSTSVCERDYNFLKSAETVYGCDLLCVICKQDTGLSDTSPARRVIYKSVIFFQCRQCEEVTHIYI